MAMYLCPVAVPCHDHVCPVGRGGYLHRGRRHVRHRADIALTSALTQHVLLAYKRRRADTALIAVAVCTHVIMYSPR